MVGTHKLGDRALILLAKLNAAMGAAVDHGIDPAIGIAHHDDRLVSDGCPFVVALVGNLTFEPHIIPRRALKYSFELALVNT